MGVKLQSSLGGSVEIAAPATASNYVLTAPATSSTIDTLARTGNVLQVVQGSTSTVVSSSTQSVWVDTGLTATITPSSAASKILVFVYHPTCLKTNANPSNDMSISLLRNGTLVQQPVNSVGYTGTAQTLYFSTSFSLLDSPATTTTLTYKTQFMNPDGSSSISVQAASTPATITLMEIAG